MPIATSLTALNTTTFIVYAIAICAVALLASLATVWCMNHMRMTGHETNRMAAAKPAISLLTALLMAITISVPAMTFVGCRAQAITTRNQVNATMTAFGKYYGVRDIRADHDDMDAVLTRTLHGGAPYNMGITYIDRKGLMRSGSIVFTRGRMFLFMAESYVNARLPITKANHTHPEQAV